MQQVITLKKKGCKICISSRAPFDLKKKFQFKVGLLPSNKVGFNHHALFSSIKAL